MASPTTIAISAASTLAGAAAAVCAAGAAALAAYSFTYPKTPKVSGRRFPTVGCCLVRFQGGPLVQIFYPADVKSGGVPFFRPEVVHNVATVFLQDKLPSFAYWFLSKRTDICEAGVPITSSAADDTKSAEGGKFPLVLFSHGLWGTLDMYRVLCSTLAAAGYVVVAPEHEDSSSMYALKEGTTTPIPFKPPPKGMKYERANVVEFRRPFLQARLSELQVVVQGVKQDAAAPVSWADIDRARLAQILGRVDTEQTILTGHSFGAATCLVALHGIQDIQFRACLLHDLWGMPVPPEVEAAAPGTLQPCPVLLMFSESFAKGKDKDVGVNLAKNLRSQGPAGASGSAVVGPFGVWGTTHQAWSDGPLGGPPWLARKMGMSGSAPRDSVYQCIADTSWSFLRAVRQGATAAEFQAVEDEMLADPMLSKL